MQEIARRPFLVLGTLTMLLFAGGVSFAVDGRYGVFLGGMAALTWGALVLGPVVREVPRD